MENVKNEIVTKEFNKNFTAFKNAYGKTSEYMGKASLSAYKCVAENKKEFSKRCKETFPELGQSTISKMVNAGLIIASANEHELELPDSYSKIYELAPVKEQLDTFYKYVDKDKKVNKEVAEMTQKEIREEVDKFLYMEEDDAIDAEVTSEEEVDDVEDGVTEEDSVVEHSIARSNVDALANALKNIIDNYEMSDELVNVLSDLEEDIRQVANTL